MAILVSLGAVLAIVVIALIGAQVGPLQYLLGILVPYAAFAIFIGGFIWRVVYWGKSPVPFRIPTTAGQEYSFPWIKRNRFDNPVKLWEVLVRMFLEVFAFRSLFRHTRAELRGGNLIYGPSKWLWLGALMFHYSFLVIALRHLRFFVQPTPEFVKTIENIDGMLQIGAPHMYLSEVMLLAGLAILLGRRFFAPRIRYVSLANDYFPLFLIIAIATTGILMRFLFRVDIVGVKELVLGLASFHPTLPDGIGAMFFIHVLLVSALLAYFPFSKLMHMGGVFMSPTRNLVNNTRMKRHVNPWWTPPKFHTYEEYEEEYRDLMKEAGIPVERE